MTDPDERMRARFLASLLLATILVYGVLVMLRYLLLPDDPSPIRGGAAVLVSFGLMIPLWLAKRGAYRSGSIVTIIIGTGAVLVTAAAEPAAEASAILGSLTILILFAGVFISPVAAIVTFGAHAACILLLVAVVPRLNSGGRWLDSVSLLAVVTLLTALITRFYHQWVAAQQARLRGQLAMFQALFDHNNDSVFVLGLDGRYLQTNERVAEILGYSLEDLQRMTFMETVAPEERSQSQDVLNRMLKGERIPLYERTFVARSGERIPLELNVALVRDSAGRPIHIQSIARDLRERRAAEAQRLRREVESQRFIVLRNFVDAISHDFRNSLSIIETGRFLVERSISPENRPAVAPRLERIQSAIDHMKSQLDHVRVVAALMNLKTAPTDLNALVEAVCVNLADKADTANVALLLVCQPNLPTVLCDAVEVSLAMEQLVLNALIHTSAGGSIVVETRVEAGQVEIRVQDNGSGIAPEHLPHIFDLFYRADGARNVATGGLGLGLSMVKMIADAHGGLIEVQSTPGVGSVFTFALPLESAPSQAALRSAPPAPLASNEWQQGSAQEVSASSGESGSN